MIKENLGLLDKTSVKSSKGWEMSVEPLKNDKNKYLIQIQAPGIGLEELNLLFDYSEVPSMNWVMPLSQDKTQYFTTMKKAGLVVIGDYTYHGKKYQCTSQKDCLLMIDNGRGHHNYGVAYFWAMIMTKLADGRVMSINLSDGFGSQYKSLEKASEDFLILDGKFYKLDVTRMDYGGDHLDFKGTKKVYTAKSDQHQKRAFPDRECDLTFTPVGHIEDGVNASLLAFKQFLIYGHFNGFCMLDGTKVEIKQAYGHVEHVYSRW